MTKAKEQYTPDESEIYYYGFSYAIFYLQSIQHRYKAINFILRNKEKFNDDFKDKVIDIAKYTIGNFKDDVLEETVEYVKLLRRFVKELRNENTNGTD